MSNHKATTSARLHTDWRRNFVCQRRGASKTKGPSHHHWTPIKQYNVGTLSLADSNSNCAPQARAPRSRRRARARAAPEVRAEHAHVAASPSGRQISIQFRAWSSHWRIQFAGRLGWRMQLATRPPPGDRGPRTASRRPISHSAGLRARPCPKVVFNVHNVTLWECPKECVHSDEGL